MSAGNNYSGYMEINGEVFPMEILSVFIDKVHFLSHSHRFGIYLLVHMTTIQH